MHDRTAETTLRVARSVGHCFTWGWFTVVAVVGSGATAQEPPAALGRAGWQRSDTGCLVWSADPMPNETASWVGPCLDGRAAGEGTLVLRSGARELRIVSTFRDGKADGYGTIFLPNGSRYEGALTEGRPHGIGEYHSANGSRFEGQWRDGKPVVPPRNVIEGTGEERQGKRPAISNSHRAKREPLHWRATRRSGSRERHLYVAKWRPVRG